MVVRVAMEGVVAAGVMKVAANDRQVVLVAESILLVALEDVEEAWEAEAVATSQLVAQAAEVAERNPRGALVVLVGRVAVAVGTAS